MDVSASATALTGNFIEVVLDSSYGLNFPDESSGSEFLRHFNDYLAKIKGPATPPTPTPSPTPAPFGGPRSSGPSSGGPPPIMAPPEAMTLRAIPTREPSDDDDGPPPMRDIKASIQDVQPLLTFRTLQQ